MSKIQTLTKKMLAVFDVQGQAKVVSADPKANTVTLQLTEGVTAKVDVSNYVSKVNLESDSDIQTIEVFTGQYAQINPDGQLVGFSPELQPVNKSFTGTSGKTSSKEIPSGLKL